MKDSRFSLGIEYTERPQVIVPIRINGFVLNPDFDKAPIGMVEPSLEPINIGPSPKSPLPAPSNDSEQFTH